MARETLQLILSNLHDERQAVHLYGRLEAAEKGVPAALFGRLRAESQKQAAIWERLLARHGAAPPPWRPGLRARLVAWLIDRLGPLPILPVLSAMKVRGLSIYRGASAAEAESRGAGGATGEESWHRATRGGGALRAAVFGVNDGLVSNASLIIGVAAADPEPGLIVVAGAAGLLAGGFSMAAGEYISVLTQREFLEHQIALEKAEMEIMPEEEIGELALIYRAKGIAPAEAEALARRIVSDPATGLDTLAREELGLDPHSLASPLVAAAASFLSFAAGAFLPLAPYLAARGPRAFTATLAITALSLLAIGGLMSLFTGRRPLWSAARMALLGLAAAAATYGIGRLLDVGVG